MNYVDGVNSRNPVDIGSTTSFSFAFNGTSIISIFNFSGNATREDLANYTV